MKKLYIIIFAIFLSTCEALAIEEITQGTTLTVNDCIELAIKHSPEVQIYKEYIEMYNARLGQSKASYFPSIGASGGYDFNNTETKYRTTNNKNFSASVYLNQLIYSFGKVFSQIKMQSKIRILRSFSG